MSPGLDFSILTNHIPKMLKITKLTILAGTTRLHISKVKMKVSSCLLDHFTPFEVKEPRTAFGIQTTSPHKLNSNPMLNQFYCTRKNMWNNKKLHS